MKEYISWFLMVCMILMMAYGSKQYQIQIDLYRIIKQQNEQYLSTYKKPENEFRTDYNRLRHGIMGGDVFPVKGKGDFYKCVKADMN